jgi:hypothetical protein
VGDTSKGDQSYERQRTETNAGEIGSDAIEAKEEAEALVFANSSRSYFMFRVTEVDGDV